MMLTLLGSSRRCSNYQQALFLMRTFRIGSVHLSGSRLCCMRYTDLYWLLLPGRTARRRFRPPLVLFLAGRPRTLHHFRPEFHHRHTERNYPCCLLLRFQQDSPHTSCSPLRVACPIHTRRILWIHPVGSCLRRTAGRFQCSVL
jgi:hypothetical protein